MQRAQLMQNAIKASRPALTSLITGPILRKSFKKALEMLDPLPYSLTSALADMVIIKLYWFITKVDTGYRTT